MKKKGEKGRFVNYPIKSSPIFIAYLERYFFLFKSTFWCSLDLKLKCFKRIRVCTQIGSEKFQEIGLDLYFQFLFLELVT